MATSEREMADAESRFRSESFAKVFYGALLPPGLILVNLISLRILRQSPGPACISKVENLIEVQTDESCPPTVCRNASMGFSKCATVPGMPGSASGSLAVRLPKKGDCFCLVGYSGYYAWAI
ncbi:hypothetical protein DM860_018006 [Cuscuta australis]|uniref:Uncharacterized protein n=1 Tax=Cuscuta australis TaxID=267555 RepID=A0A328D3P3_9ASTE|nr:hypothetical protein DM860_018006 [Cuscuta australis]